MAANHLGPYSQEGTWQITGTHKSGEASDIFVVDLNGFRYLERELHARPSTNFLRSMLYGRVRSVNLV